MEGRPLYRTVAAIGLGAHALSSVVHLVVSKDPFFAVLLAVAAIAAGVVWSWANGIWVGLVVGILLELATFWFVFPMIQGFSVSALDAVPALIGFVGVWTAIIASILGAKRRGEARAFSDSTKKRVLMGAGAIVALAVVSTALTFANQTTVDAAEATGATTVLMHDGDKFTPEELNAETGQPMKLLLRNDDIVGHTFDVEDYDVQEVVGPGSEKVITFTPTKSGDVEFVCAFHADMKGEITVS